MPVEWGVTAGTEPAEASEGATWADARLSPSHGRVLHRSFRRPVRAARPPVCPPPRCARCSRWRRVPRSCRSRAGCRTCRRCRPSDVLDVVRQVLATHGMACAAVRRWTGAGLAARAARDADGRRRASTADPEDVVVTTGAQQALDLVGEDLHRTRATRSRSRRRRTSGALTAFSAYEPRYLQIDLDDDGMIVDQLEEAAAARRAAQVRLHVPELRQSRRCDDIIQRREQLVSLCREAGSPSSRTTRTACSGSKGSRCPACEPSTPRTSSTSAPCRRSSPPACGSAGRWPSSPWCSDWCWRRRPPTCAARPSR